MTSHRAIQLLPLGLFLLMGCGDELRLNHIQMRGTEESHTATDPTAGDPQFPLPYSHHALVEQVGTYGTRYFELSTSYNPLTHTLEARTGWAHHSSYSQCDRLAQCLETIAVWSRSHRQHHPLVITIQPNGRDNLYQYLDVLQDEIAAIFQRWQIITPGEVTAGYPDLRTALAERGWPAIELSRGRTMFVLNDRGRTRDAYLAGRFLDPDEPRLLFTVADSPEVPYAGIFSFPDVTAANQAQIRALVEQGYLVRAITNTEDAVQRAIDNGVHFLSTRYPDDLLPPDRLGGFPSGCNPITTDETCDPSMIELPPQ